MIIAPKLIERKFGNLEGLNHIASFNCNINKLLNYHLNYNLHHVN